MMQALQRPINIAIYDGAKKILEKSFSRLPISIGRDSASNICLSDYSFLSRQHALLTEIDGGLFLMDLKSQSLVFRGKIVPKAPIFDGVQINIGSLLFIITRQSLQSSLAATDEHTPTHLKKTQIAVLKNNRPQAKRWHAGSQEPKQAVGQSHLAPDHPEPHSLKTLPHLSSGVVASEKSEPPLFKGYFLPIENTGRLSPQVQVLESYVTWHGNIIDIQQKHRGEVLTLGNNLATDLFVPHLPSTLLAKFDSRGIKCVIPEGLKVSITEPTQVLGHEALVQNSLLTKHRLGQLLNLGIHQLCTVEITKDISVHLRYAQAPRPLSKTKLLAPGSWFKPAIIGSVFVHMTLFLLAALLAPTESLYQYKRKTPRYVHISIEKVKPIEIPEIKPPPPPRPPPPLAELMTRPVPVEKVPPTSPKPRPEKPIVRKLPQKINKFPLDLPSTRVVRTKPAVEDVRALGTLAALSQISNSLPSNESLDITINKDLTRPSTTTLDTPGVIGTLKSTAGSLKSGGLPSQIATKGYGVGSGQGYDVENIKGGSGKREVGGVVLGRPQLMRIGKNDGLSQQQVMAVVQKNIGQIQQCYEKSLMSNPELAGRIEYEWNIQASGQVSSVQIKSSDMRGADALNECVKGIFLSMKFPIAKNGESTTPKIGFPFGRL